MDVMKWYDARGVIVELTQGDRLLREKAIEYWLELIDVDDPSQAGVQCVERARKDAEMVVDLVRSANRPAPYPGQQDG